MAVNVFSSGQSQCFLVPFTCLQWNMVNLNNFLCHIKNFNTNPCFKWNISENGTFLKKVALVSQRSTKNCTRKKCVVGYFEQNHQIQKMHKMQKMITSQLLEDQCFYAVARNELVSLPTSKNIPIGISCGLFLSVDIVVEWSNNGVVILQWLTGYLRLTLVFV